MDISRLLAVSLDANFLLSLHEHLHGPGLSLTIQESLNHPDKGLQEGDALGGHLELLPVLSPDLVLPYSSTTQFSSALAKGQSFLLLVML